MAGRLKVLTADENDLSSTRWEFLEDLLKGYDPDPDPDPDTKVLFFDDFRGGITIIDGQKPAPSGLVLPWYDDSFPGWGVRSLSKPPNNDQGWKKFTQGVTHDIIDGQILALRANKHTSSPTGYLAGMLSTERSFTFLNGRVRIRMRVPAFGPGMHFSLWLMPADRSTDMEYDILELIGSNSFMPNGPVNSLFFNAKNKVSGAWLEKSVQPGFIKEWHDYEFIWDEHELVWMIDDVQVHRTDRPDLMYKKPMYLMLTHEVGASANGDFPGPVNPKTPWPCEVQISEIRVEKLR